MFRLLRLRPTRLGLPTGFRPPRAVGTFRSLRAPFSQGSGAGGGAGGGAGDGTGSGFRRKVLGTVGAVAVAGLIGYKGYRSHAYTPDGLKIIRVKYYDGSPRSEYTEVLGRRHGTYTEYHEGGGGKQKKTCSYKDGRLEGEYMEWNREGAMVQKSHYKDGKREGEYVEWDCKGTMVQKAHYKEGKLEGPYHKWHSNGIVAEEANYRDDRIWEGDYIRRYYDGTLREKGVYKDGKKSGLFTGWHLNGKVASESHHGDTGEQGERVEWHDNGIVRKRSHYKDGLQEGIETCWHRDGEKEQEGEYRGGKREGTFTCWHPNGRKKQVIEYRADNSEGIITWWDDKGTVVKRIEYQAGRPSKVLTLLDRQGRETVLPAGEITVWKLCNVGNDAYAYVQIRVPKEAKRVTPADSDGTYKGRVEYGTVISITGQYGGQYQKAWSFVQGPRTEYTVGQEVRPTFLNEDPGVECGEGINVHVHRDHCDQWIPKHYDYDDY